jgi:hypothetical protein
MIDWIMDGANGEITDKLARRREHFVDNSVVAVVVVGNWFSQCLRGDFD